MVSITHEKHKFTQIEAGTTFIIKLFVWAQKQTTFQPYISFVRNVTPGHTLAQTTARTNVWQILGSVSDPPKFCPQILVLSELLLVNAELRN